MLQASTDYDIRDAANIFDKQMRVFMTQEKAARKQARRCRVRRQSQDLMGEDLLIDEDYSQIEKASLNEVQKAAFAAGFESFSDDEGEEPSGEETKPCEWSHQWAQEWIPVNY